MKERKELLDLMYETIHSGQTRMNKKVAYEKLENEAQTASVIYHRSIEKTLFISREIFQTIGTCIDVPGNNNATGGIIECGVLNFNRAIVCVMFQEMNQETTKLEMISYVKQGLGRKKMARQALKRYEDLIIKI